MGLSAMPVGVGQMPPDCGREIAKPFCRRDVIRTLVQRIEIGPEVLRIIRQQVTRRRVYPLRRDPPRHQASRHQERGNNSRCSSE
jgi:hypothetical protein